MCKTCYQKMALYNYLKSLMISGHSIFLLYVFGKSAGDRIFVNRREYFCRGASSSKSMKSVQIYLYSFMNQTIGKKTFNNLYIAMWICENMPKYVFMV